MRQKRRTTSSTLAISRRAQKLIAVLCSVIIAAAIYCDNRYSKTAPASPPATGASSQSESDFEKYNAKTFTVVKVVDGDTLDIDISDGKYKTTRIRLLGVDTPETKKPNTPVMYYGPEAYEYAKAFALKGQVTVLIDTVSPARDRYGRLLAYIKMAYGSTLNEELIIHGYGYADLRFKHSRFEKFKELQNQAIARKAGLWKHVKFEQFPSWLQKIRPDILIRKAA